MTQYIKNMADKYFIYARKSSEAEDKQMASIDDQISELRKMAKSQGLNVIDTLYESKSAKEPGRRVFNEMLERIKQGEANGILCWKINRLARNPVDSGQINWLLQKSVIKQITTFGKSYYPTDNVLYMAMENGMATQYVIDLSIDTKRGLRNKAERGWYPTKATVGYKSNPGKVKGEKEIIKDKNNFLLVRKMFDMVLSGNYTPPQVLTMANEKWGITNSYGRKLCRSNFYRMLSDTFYYGMYEYPQNSGSWYKGKHEPMITELEYDKIQAILGKTNRARPRIHSFAFTGMMVCGECGASITAEKKIKKQINGTIHHYSYYHCTKRIKKCSQSVIPVAELEKQVSDKLLEIEINEDLKEWMISRLKLKQAEKINEKQSIITNLKREKTLCKNKLSIFIDMRAGGEITAEDYQFKKSETELTLLRINNQLNGLEERSNDWLNDAKAKLDLATNGREKFEHGTNDKKREILSLIGSNRLLLNGKLEMLVEKPLQLIANIPDTTRREFELVRTADALENKRTIAVLYDNSPVMLRRLHIYRNVQHIPDD
ncbi:MAG: recombinase family protein [bacterium]|nr:recombinase family protein [bacterium]